MTLQLLRGIRVIELSLIIPGNQTGGLLADLGADVIKIEPPPFGDYIREVFPVDREKHAGAADMLLNRNKRSLTVDLKKEDGLEVFYRLLRTADVVFDLSLPGTRERLKADYESCKKIKPDIIYFALTGFGYTGPYSRIPAHGYGPDAVAGSIPIHRDDKGRYTLSQRMGTPPYAPLFSALAIASAIVQRQLTGEGCFLETSLVDANVQTRYLEVYQHFNPAHPWEQMTVGATSPRYNVYECADGKFVLFAAIEHKFWKRFCDVIERPDLLEGEGWSERVMDFGREDEALLAELNAIFRTRPMREWVTLVGGAGVPCTPANTLTDLLNDREYVEARQMTTTYHDPRLDDEVTLAAFPVKRPGVEFRVERPAPDPGQHNAEVLTELGYSGDEQRQLYATGALFHPKGYGKPGE